MTTHPSTQFGCVVCKWIDYPTPKWYEAIGISVLVEYANSTDRVTLYKAWLRLVP